MSFITPDTLISITKSLLLTFYSLLKIESAFSSKDIDTFTTLVHSLKSSARTVGAREISDLARTLETAGKNKDLDRIQKDTPRLLEMYKSLEAPLTDILKL